MITPTRTVCYAIPEEDAEQKLKVTYASPVGLTVEYSKGLCGLLDYSEVRRIIVREEPIEQYHPWVVNDGDLSDLKIESGEIKRYPSKCLCQKDRMCNTCFQTFVAYNQATAWSLPSAEMFGHPKWL